MDQVADGWIGWLESGGCRLDLMASGWMDRVVLGWIRWFLNGSTGWRMNLVVRSRGWNP